MTKSATQHLKDFIFVPFRFAGFTETNPTIQRLNLTSLEGERILATLPHLKGKLLDVGCGYNRLVQAYQQQGGEGVGVDIFDYGGGATIVENSADLPFADNSFDTLAYVANLNHIPYRLAALKEAHRILKDDGVLVATMINPIIGLLVHKVFELRHTGMDVERGMIEGELYGMWSKDIIELGREAGFECVQHKRFLYMLNNLFIFKKAP